MLMTLTKALFALEKLWTCGTPLLPSMLLIILSRFQTSIVFFLNNSHLIYTFFFLLLQYLTLHYIQKLPTTYNVKVTYNLTMLTKLTILTLFTIC